MYISATGYLEEGALCFTKVIEDKEMIEDGRKAETVSDSEEKNKKKALYIKRKRTHGFYHLQPLIRLRLRLLCLYLGPLLCLRLHLHLLSLCLDCPLFCHPLFRLRLMYLCLCLGHPLFYGLLLESAFGVSMLVPGLSILPSMSSVSSVSVLLPRLSAPPSVSVMPVPISGSSLPPFLI